MPAVPAADRRAREVLALGHWQRDLAPISNRNIMYACPWLCRRWTSRGAGLRRRVHLLGVLHGVLGVLRRVLGVLRRVLRVVYRLLGVLRRVLGVGGTAQGTRGTRQGTRGTTQGTKGTLE